MKKFFLSAILIFCFAFTHGQSGNFEKNIKKGINAAKSGKYQEAIPFFNLSIDEQPTAEAYYNRATTYLKTGDSCNFCKDLKNAAELNDEFSKQLYEVRCLTSRINSDVPNSIKLKYPLITHFLTKHEKCSSDSAVYFVERLGDYLQEMEISKIDKDFYHIDTSSSFVIVENMPVFIGGSEAMQIFLKQNLIYPDEASQKNIEGNVFISFIVEQDGSISTIKILKGIGGGCDEEAVRIVSLMPQWTPGTQKGIAVRARLNLKVSFNLNNYNNSNPYAYLNRAMYFLKEGDTCRYCGDISTAAFELNNVTAKKIYNSKCNIIDTVRINSDTISQEFPGYNYSISKHSYCDNVSFLNHYDSAGKSIQSVFDKFPEFPEGDNAMNKFLSTTIRYPQKAVEKGIQGNVYVSFCIEIDGTVSEINILRGPGGGLREESIRVVKLMPKWKPGTRKGTPVKVKFNMPINFSLGK